MVYESPFLEGVSVCWFGAYVVGSFWVHMASLKDLVEEMDLAYRAESPFFAWGGVIETLVDNPCVCKQV